MTEITENHGRTLFYDGECQLCISGIQRVRCLLARREIQCTALQAAGVAEQLGLTPEHLLLEMKFRDTTGTVHGGADAYVALARLYWWAWPLYLLAHFPGARLLLRWGYKRLAAKRYCIRGSSVGPRIRSGRWRAPGCSSTVQPEHQRVSKRVREDETTQSAV